MDHSEKAASVTSTSMTSWGGSTESLTASTASLQHLTPTTPTELTDATLARTRARSHCRVRAGPGLLLFPGTAQRHQANLMSQSQRMKATTAKANANEEHVVINQRKPNSVRSFRRPPLWQHCPERRRTSTGEEEREQEAPQPAQPVDACADAACVGKAQAFIIEFLLGSSIHGFIYLAKRGLNFVERWVFAAA